MASRFSLKSWRACHADLKRSLQNENHENENLQFLEENDCSSNSGHDDNPSSSHSSDEHSEDVDLSDFESVYSSGAENANSLSDAEIDEQPGLNAQLSRWASENRCTRTCI